MSVVVMTFSPEPEPAYPYGSDGRIIWSQIGWDYDWDEMRNGVDDSKLVAYPSSLYDGVAISTRVPQLVRSILLFNTRPISSLGTVIAATLSLYGKDKRDDKSLDFDVDIYTSDPKDDNALIGVDYRTLGDVALTVAPINYDDLVVDGWNTWTFNAIGIATIQTTWATKLGVRFTFDADNNDPGASGSWPPDEPSYFSWESADNVNKPILEVTFDRTVLAGLEHGLAC